MSGGSLDEAAKQFGLEVLESADLAPGQTIAGTGGLSSEAKSRLFGSEAREGDRGHAPVPAGALIYEITSREPFDPQRFRDGKAALHDEVLVQRRNQLQQSLLAGLQQRQQIEVNDAVIERYNGVSG